MTKNRVFIAMVLVGLMVLLAACQFDMLTGYNISGKVTDASGAGIAGVKLSFTTLTSTCETANDGSWSMTGLKGSVVVTPAKEGYIFTPASQTVTSADANVDFTADITDELKIKDLVVKYGEYLADADAEAVIALYDDSYFGGVGHYASRQEMIDSLASELDSVAYNLLDVVFVNITSNAETAQAGFMYDLIITDLEENSSLPFQPYMHFDLVKRENQWLITHDVPYSPEESILQSKCQAFLDALVNNDLASTQPLVSDTVSMDGGTYDEFIAEWTTILQNMDVTAFTFDREEIFRHGVDNYVRLAGQVTVVVNEVEELRDCYFWFHFEEISGDWLITLVQWADFSY